MWIEPEKIMTITLVLIMLTLGIFILGTIANTQSNVDKYYTSTFPITTILPPFISAPSLGPQLPPT